MGANGVDIQDIRKNATSVGIAYPAIKHTSSPWLQQEMSGLVRLYYADLLLIGQLNSADFC